MSKQIHFKGKGQLRWMKNPLAQPEFVLGQTKNLRPLVKLSPDSTSFFPQRDQLQLMMNSNSQRYLWSGFNMDPFLA